MTDNIENGIFEQEISNRFQCVINFNGIYRVCYIASSCRLSNFIDLKGRKVLLTQNKSNKAKTQYSLYAVKYKRNYIILNSLVSNEIIEEQLSSRRFSFLGKRNNIKRECNIEGYKSDFYIEDSKTLIEVKSMISINKNAVHPSVYSERALQQLEKISSLLDRGYRAVYIFVALNPYIIAVDLLHETPFFGLLNECMEKGMKVIGYSIQMKNMHPEIKKRIDINI